MCIIRLSDRHGLKPHLLIEINRNPIGHTHFQRYHARLCLQQIKYSFYRLSSQSPLLKIRRNSQIRQMKFPINQKTHDIAHKLALDHNHPAKAVFAIARKLKIAAFPWRGKNSPFYFYNPVKMRRDHLHQHGCHRIIHHLSNALPARALLVFAANKKAQPSPYHPPLPVRNAPDPAGQQPQQWDDPE